MFASSEAALPSHADPSPCRFGLEAVVDDVEDSRLSSLDPRLSSTKTEERGAIWVWNHVENEVWSGTVGDS